MSAVLIFFHFAGRGLHILDFMLRQWHPPPPLHDGLLRLSRPYFTRYTHHTNPFLAGADLAMDHHLHEAH